jgi:hypothetical protein
MDMNIFTDWLLACRKYWDIDDRLAATDLSAEVRQIDTLLVVAIKTYTEMGNHKYNFSYLEDQARWLMDEWYALGLRTIEDDQD